MNPKVHQHHHKRQNFDQSAQVHINITLFRKSILKISASARLLFPDWRLPILALPLLYYSFTYKL